jgi:polyferredoxin
MANSVIISTEKHPVTRGIVKARRKGWARLNNPQTLRRLVQLAVFGFIAFIAARHFFVGESSASVVASWEAYCPLGGLETLYKYVVSGGSYVSHTHLSNVVILVAALLTALLARNAFCGWVCPFGFIQDLISVFSRFLQRKIPALRKAVKQLKARAAWLAVVDKPLRLLKYVVLVWAVGGAAVYGILVFRDYDPWAALLNLTELSLGVGTAVLGVILVASLFVERPWCRYACPLGAATGLVSKLSPVYLRREASACKACAICSRSCPMGLNVHEVTTIKNQDCIGCLECVEDCPREGALELKIGVPVIGQ